MTGVAFYYFKAESGGDGAGSKWVFKGTVAENYVDPIVRGLDSGDHDLIAEALGTLSGEGKYMIIPQSTTERVEVVAKRAFQAKKAVA